MEVMCEVCKNIFKRKPSEIGKNIYCSRKCYLEAISKDKTLNGRYSGGQFVPCVICGKKHYRRPSTLKKQKGRYCCSVKCKGQWGSQNMIGEMAGNFKNALRLYRCGVCSKKFRSYHKNTKYCSVQCRGISQRNRISIDCLNCGKVFKRYPSQIKWSKPRNSKRMFCSKMCFEKYNVGEKSSVYIKDRSKIKNQKKTTRASFEMKDWRKSVFERDDYTCQLCSDRGGKGNPVILNAHHIIRFADSYDKMFDMYNGITLCESCHKKTYSKEKEFELTFNRILNNKNRQRRVEGKKREVSIGKITKP